MLIERKIKSALEPSQITLLLYIEISSGIDLASALFKHFYIFLVKVSNDATIKNLIRVRILRSENWYTQKRSEPKLYFSKRYHEADLMLLFNKGSSLIINGLSSNSKSFFCFP